MVVRYEGGYDGCSRKGEYLMETWMGMAVHSPRSEESGETEMQRQRHYSMSNLGGVCPGVAIHWCVACEEKGRFDQGPLHR